MKLKKVLALALALCLAVTAFAGCTPSGTASTESKTESTTESKAEESTAVVPTGDTSAYPGTPEANAITVDLNTEPPELNTLTSSYAVSFNVIRHIIENLVMLDANDEVIPGVAESWTISDDGLNYTFKLREGMKWTNGEPVTAKDFTFAWEKLLTPGFGEEYSYFAFIFKNGENFFNYKSYEGLDAEGKAAWEGEVPAEIKAEDLGFKAVSDYELQVTLENPTAYGLFMFTFGSLAPINQKFYDEVGAENYMIDTDKFCTNGAFTMENWTHDSNIVLKKNPDFYKAGDVSLEQITFAMLKDSNTAMNSFKAGEVDMIALNGDQTTQMANEGFPTLSFSDGAEFHVLMNTKDQYLSNVNLRRAIHYGYDRDAYIKAIRKDSSSPAASFTNPGVVGSDGKSFAAAVEAKYGILNPANVDVEKAKGYLETALTELGVTIADLNAHLSMNCGDSDAATLQAAFFQEQLRVNLGIEIQIKSMTTKAQSAERTSRNYVMDFTGWSPDYNDPMTFLDMWVTGGGNNSVDFSNPRYDELIGLASKEMDLAKRQEYFLECEKILADEVPISATYWRMMSYAVSDKLASKHERTTFQDMNYTYATIK